MRSGRVRWLILVAVAGLVAACGGGGGDDVGSAGDDGPASAASAGGDGDVVVAVGNDLITLDPQAVQDYPGRVIYGNVFESLFVRGSDGALEPLLAAAPPTPVDATTWEVALRTDVRWHDGSPFTAADVAYSINRVVDPDFRTQQASLFLTIVGAEVVDESTVRIRTSSPDPILADRLALLLIVKDGDAERPDFAEHPIGTGPYAFVSRTPGSETVIERWQDYRQPLAEAPDSLTLRVMPEPRTRVAALENGEVDIVPALSPDDVPLVPRAEAVTGTEAMLLRLNARSGVLADERLRQAINLAVDRQELVDALFSGYAEPANCQIAAPTVFGHAPSLEVPPYDPERARRLIEQAGAEGATLSFTAPASRFAKGREIAQAVESYLEDVGFDVELEFPSDQVMAKQLLQPPSFPNIFMYSANTEFFDETKQLQWLTTRGQFSGSADEAIDELAEQVQQELDPEAREQLFAQINERACENVSNVYLFFQQDLYGLSDDIDWTPRADGLIVAAEISV
jgi:peptide/nickel transport system substrate-binding protein